MTLKLRVAEFVRIRCVSRGTTANRESEFSRIRLLPVENRNFKDQ
jgi:hypothetical protein